jgi:hypothetical protein
VSADECGFLMTIGMCDAVLAARLTKREFEALMLFQREIADASESETANDTTAEAHERLTIEWLASLPPRKGRRR